MSTFSATSAYPSAAAIRPDATHGHGPHPWVRLRSLIRVESRDLWVAALYSAGIGVISLVVPVAIQALVNTVSFGIVLQPLVILTLLVFGALCAAAVLQVFRFWVVEVLQRRIFVRTAGEVADRLIHARAAALEAGNGPELVNRFLEVVNVQKAASTLLLDGMSVVFQAVAGMILLAVYHPWLLAFDVLLAALIGVVIFGLSRGAIATSVAESKAKYQLVAWLEEIARHQIVFKTGEGGVFAWHQTNHHVTHYLAERTAHFRILIRQIAGSFALQAVASAGLLGVGGWLVLSRQLTLGQLVAAELVVALVLTGFTKFGKHLETFYDLMAAVDKLGILTDLEVEPATGHAFPPERERAMAIELRQVSGGPDPRTSVLHQVNWSISAGERIGLVGPAGAGKSFLIDLLYGARTPSSGFIEYDGIDLRGVDLAALRSQVAVIRQPELFEGTLLENLTLSPDAVLSLDVRDALKRVGLLEAVMQLPNGLNTRVLSGGLPLSPGQRIQLEIARALLRRPRLLILDESLDALQDLPGLDALVNTLFDPKAPWTLIIATHAPGVLRRCTRIYRLDAGTLAHVQAPDDPPARA